jgi:hypothetical protein
MAMTGTQCSFYSGQDSFSRLQKFISNSFQRNKLLSTIDRLDETKNNTPSPNKARFTNSYKLSYVHDRKSQIGYQS